jgi:hypothetical protein
MGAAAGWDAARGIGVRWEQSIFSTPTLYKMKGWGFENKDQTSPIAG